jgi:hypothetical protein
MSRHKKEKEAERRMEQYRQRWELKQRERDLKAAALRAATATKE